MKAILVNLARAGLAGLLALSTLAGPRLQPDGESGAARDKKPGTALEAGLGAVDVTSQGCGQGVIAGLGVLHYIERNIAFEFSLERFSVPLEEGVLSLGKGRLSVIPATFSLVIRIGAGSRLAPYALLGAGFYFYSFAPEAAAAALEAHVTDRMAAHLGAGLEWAVTPRWAVGIDARYAPVSTFIQPDRDAQPDPAVYPKVRFDQLAVRAVVRCYL